MKKTLVFTLFLSGLFSSTTSSVIKSQVEQKEKNIGHFIFPFGLSMKAGHGYPVFGLSGIGYQTKIRDASYIQSILVEVGNSFNISTEADKYELITDIESRVILPKISFIRYLNSTAENRFFLSLGSYFSFSFLGESYSYNGAKNLDNPEVPRDYIFGGISGNTGASIGAAFSAGVELGHTYGAINILKLECNLPVIHSEYYIDSYAGEPQVHKEKIRRWDWVLNTPTINITYAVGF